MTQGQTHLILQIRYIFAASLKGQLAGEFFFFLFFLNRGFIHTEEHQVKLGSINLDWD